MTVSLYNNSVLYIGKSNFMNGAYKPTINIHHNEIWGGNPSSKIKESIFWERSCVHGWDEDDTQNSLTFSSIAEKKHLPMEVYKFEYDERVCISYKEIEEKFSSKDIKSKIDYLDYITSIDEKNRFVHY